MKIFITPTRNFHTTPPSRSDGVPPLRGGLTIKHRKTQILISYPPPKFFVFILWKLFSNHFHFGFHKTDTKIFSRFSLIFSTVGMRIFLKSFEKPNQNFHITPPSRSDGVPPLRGGLTIKHREKHRKTTQILISYPPPKFFVFILQNWFEKSFCKSDTETKNKMKIK